LVMIAGKAVGVTVEPLQVGFYPLALVHGMSPSLKQRVRVGQ
jgi:hypothetical protein